MKNSEDAPALPAGRQKQGETLGDAFAKLRRICADEGYTLVVSPRHERPNPFPDVLDELSR